MIKYTRLFITFLLATIVFQVRAQSTATTSSPYSQFGIGEPQAQALPQNIGMGELTTAVNNFSGFFNINPSNPASYGAIGLTVIDLGIYGNVTTLSQTGQPSVRDANFRLNHVTFAFPITKHSAISFGLLPYTQMGYNYLTTKKNFGTTSPADTNQISYIYSGDGGLSKAYLGYGINIGKHLLIGANVSYIFGNLHQYASTEIDSLAGTLYSEVQNNDAIRGVNYDYGLQYTIDLSATRHIILGYSGSASTSLSSQNTYLIDEYTYDDDGNQNVPLDTLVNTQQPKSKVKLPLINSFGVTFLNDNKLLLGAQYTMENWSQLSINGINQGLQNSKTYNLGGQITPDANALNNFWQTVDYKFGLIYNQSYITINDPSNNSNTNIKNYALTFGLGMPLHPNQSRTSFYKINIAAEVGREGTLENGLVRETYVNLHLSFTLNDRWFIKYKVGE